MNALRRIVVAACFAAIVSPASLVQAGGNIDEWDVTGFHPSPIPGEVIGTTRGYRWDDRCIPAGFRVNATMDPIPNGIGQPPISLAETMTGLRRAFEMWNEIPTSYIDLRIVGTTQSAVPPGFDFVNEVSFVWPAGLGAVGFSPSTVLLADATFLHGEDLDGDGDADVSSAVLTCADTDGDGDIEFPAGRYAAGTILDNDVMLNPRVRFTVDGSGLEQLQTYDLVGVTAHELGHSHGLAHSGIVQKSPRDGTAATMYNSFRDAIDKFAMRTLYSDDIAWSSFLYPEGTRKHGPAALQKGDVAFDRRYAVIRGEVKDAHGRPVTGSVVFAEDYQGNVVSSAVGGRARASLDLAQANPFFIPFTLLPPELGVVDGKYALPVPKGLYKIGIEPNDQFPEPTLATSAGLVGYLYGSQNFIEEYYNGLREGDTERRLDHARPVAALADRHGIDFRLEDNVHVLSINTIDYGSNVLLAPGGTLVAVRVPRERVLAVDRGRGVLIQAATFGTFPIDTTPVAVYRSAMITTGKVGADGNVSVDIDRPLVVRAPFVGQDLDYTPLYVDQPWLLGQFAQRVLPATGKDLFLVLRFTDDEYAPFPGTTANGIFGDVLTAGDTDFNASYYSFDGGATWSRDVGFEYAFGLVVAPR